MHGLDDRARTAPLSGSIREDAEEERSEPRQQMVADGTCRELDSAVAENARVDRRQERREMHVDRRKSDVDLVERLIGGVRADCVRATSDDRAPRPQRRK